jgi:fused signal recognition particle receptor
MSETSKNPVPAPAGDQWDEPRLVVFLIGICLLIEGGLIYYQAGESQTIVAAITGAAGLTLLAFAWLVPLEEEAALRPDQGEPTPVGYDAAQNRAIEPGAAIEPPPGSPLLPSDGLAEPRQPPPVAGLAGEPVVVPPADLVGPTAPPIAVEPVVEPEPEPQLSWFERLRQGLSKTRSQFVGKVKRLVFGVTKIDGDTLDELEATLFEADIGVKTTQELLEFLHKRVEQDEIKDPNAIFGLLRDQLRLRLTRFSPQPNLNPEGVTVFLIIGVNGVGKTTTIAKLARLFIKQGKKVLLAAGDTFRAAAIDQIGIWGDRVGAEVIRGQEGGDPGALVFDAIHAARKRGANLLIVDTAGRMHVKTNLMDELKKMRKIIEKESDGGPHETLLVIDATTGQNAVQQAKLFNEALPITGLVVTKLDGTAKGGVLFAVEEQISAPVKFIGVGEKMDDLMGFDPEEFLDALFADEENKAKESDYKVL